MGAPALEPFSEASLSRLLDVIEHEILPKTRAGVAAGNKIFGAAILRKSDLSVVVAATNGETENPIWHGEMQAIRRFYALDPAGRSDPKECLFLATHEPCSLCLSGITWSGFDNFIFLFSHEDSRDRFAIPYDIQILQAVYAVADPDRSEPAAARPLYNRQNAFWTSFDLKELITTLPPSERNALVRRVEQLSRIYGELSDAYQTGKGGEAIPLA